MAAVSPIMGLGCNLPSFIKEASIALACATAALALVYKVHMTNTTKVRCAAFAYATAALSPTMDIANAVLLTWPTALLFAAGYLLRWRDIPRYWLWFGYINWCATAC